MTRGRLKKTKQTQHAGIPIIERKALASAGLTLLSSREASHMYRPTSAVVGLTMVRRRPKEPTPLATSTPFLLHTKFSFSTGLEREKQRGKEIKTWQEKERLKESRGKNPTSNIDIDIAVLTRDVHILRKRKLVRLANLKRSYF